MDHRQSERRAQHLERKAGGDLAAPYTGACRLQGRRRVECHAERAQRDDGHRSGPAGAVLRRGSGKDLRQLRGSPKAGARAEAVHPVCSGEGRCTVWPGTYAGGLRHRAGHCITRHGCCGYRWIDFHDIAAGDRGQDQRSGVLEQHPAVGCHAAGRAVYYSFVLRYDHDSIWAYV